MPISFDQPFRWREASALSVILRCERSEPRRMLHRRGPSPFETRAIARSFGISASALIPEVTVDRYDFAFAAHRARSFAFRWALEIEGAGKTGCALHPRSHGRVAIGMLPTSIQVQRRASGLPCAMALRLIRDRPGDPALCDTIAGSKLSPLANLTPASGRRTQSISPYAGCSFVSRAAASIAPCPSFATMAYAPPVGQDGGNNISDFPIWLEIYLKPLN